jgi:hypothetical protein
MARRRRPDVAGPADAGPELADRWASLAEERRQAVAAAVEAGLLITADHVAVARLALDGAIFLAYGDVVAGSRRHPLTDGFWVLAAAETIVEVVRVTASLDDAARVLTRAVERSSSVGRPWPPAAGVGLAEDRRHGLGFPRGRVVRGDWGPFGEGWAVIRQTDEDHPDPVVLAGAPVLPSRRRALRALASR